MKKLIFLFVLITNIVVAQTTIYTDNMEHVGWTWKGIPKVLITSGYVGGISSATDSPSNVPLYSSPDSCFRLLGVGLGSSAIEKDTLLYTNVSGLNPNGFYRISFKISSIGINPSVNAASGVDGSDYIQLDWSNDGGLTYRPEIKILGSSNSTWGFNSASGVSVIKTSSGVSTSYSSSSLLPITSVNLDVPINTTQISLRIIMAVNAVGESWCVDDVNLSLITCLPIELLSFSADKKENGVLLNWVTVSETNNDYFILSKSKDAIEYFEVVKIGGSGNSNELKNYEFFDSKPYNGINYYTLTQVDYDGKKSTSYPIAIRLNENKIKNIKKIVNVLGQEVDEDYKGLKIYYFDDDTFIKSY
jgi:hypothetical protein